MALRKCKVSSVHQDWHSCLKYDWLRQWEIISLSAHIQHLQTGSPVGMMPGHLHLFAHWHLLAAWTLMIQFREMIVGQIAPSSDAGQSLEVLTQPIISNKFKKQRGKWISHAVCSALWSHSGFIFSPPLCLFPFFIIHLSLLAALYPAEQQEVRVWIITILIQTISYVASLSSFCSWSP